MTRCSNSHEGQSSEKIKRRRVLQGLGVAASASIAGCQGDSESTTPGDGGSDEDSGSDLGERVPDLTVTYWSDAGARTTVQEEALTVIRNNINETLNLEIEVQSDTIIGGVVNRFENQQVDDLMMGSYGPRPSRLDPGTLLQVLSIENAGGNGDKSNLNLADCSISEKVAEQASAADPEERRKLIDEALGEASHKPLWPNYAKMLNLGSIRTDEVEPGGIGIAGLKHTAPYPFIESEPKNGDSINVASAPAVFQSMNYMALSTNAWMVWGHLVYSTLTEYNEENELVNMLAEDIEFSNGGETITVTLRDATFHNGDPITAEDVKFTFELIWENPAAYPHANAPDWDTIEAVDEKTVEFRLNEPSVALQNTELASWGILHSRSWKEAGAMEEPSEVSLDPIIGSGPFQVDSFENNRELQLSPHDGHPVHEPSHRLNLRSFQDTQTAMAAFENNEVQIVPGLSPNLAQKVQDMDEAELFNTPAITDHFIYPDLSHPPIQFSEIRDAIGKLIDRNAINEIALGGLSEPENHSSLISRAHPFYNEEVTYEFTDDISGDPDAAVQVLEDAGYGFDDNGNLRYPADKDLSPNIPKQEEVEPADYPCLNEDGTYKSGDYPEES